MFKKDDKVKITGKLHGNMSGYKNKTVTIQERLKNIDGILSIVRYKVKENDIIWCENELTLV